MRSFVSRPLLSMALLMVFALNAHSQSVSRPEPTGRIIPSGAELTVVSKDFELADGAAWDGAGRLFVPDVRAQRLRTLSLRSPEDPAKTRLSKIAISGTCYQLGKLYFADNQGSRIAIISNNGSEKTLAQFSAKQRPNDLVVDAMGTCYVTFTPEGVVRKITPNGEVTILVDGLSSPNGIGLSPDGSTLYVSSFKDGIIYRITLPDGVTTNDAADDTNVRPEAFAQMPNTDDGFRGDGMTVDRAGNVYVTGAESVVVFDPLGKIIDALYPPERPINVVIGGLTGRQLFVSTFGGVYQVGLAGYAVLPNPAMTDDGPGDAPSGRSANERKANDASRGGTSTLIHETIDAQLNVVYAKDGDRKLLMDVFTPKSGLPAKPAVIIVHGGGWQKGDKNRFRALALRLAERGYVSAAIEYRLSHEARFPAGIRDCNAATVFLRENASRFGIDPHRIAAAGGSAGGHLVGLMGAGAENDTLKHSADKGKNSSLKAIAVLAGPLQIATGSVADRANDPKANSNAVQWLGSDLSESAELYHLADAHEKITASMPPTLFMCGSKDDPGRNKLSRDKMADLGVFHRLIVHPEARHGHWNHRDWIDRVATDLDGFFKQQL